MRLRYIFKRALGDSNRFGTKWAGDLFYYGLGVGTKYAYIKNGKPKKAVKIGIPKNRGTKIFSKRGTIYRRYRTIP